MIRQMVTIAGGILIAVLVLMFVAVIWSHPAGAAAVAVVVAAVIGIGAMVNGSIAAHRSLYDMRRQRMEMEARNAATARTEPPRPA